MRNYLLLIVATFWLTSEPLFGQAHKSDQPIYSNHQKSNGMSVLKELKKRNNQFAENYEGGLSIMPKLNTVILTCIDARIDPAHFLGLDLGEAIIFRNPGGRVTPEFERDLGIIMTMAANKLGSNFQGINLAIIHHTECGYENLSNPNLQLALHTNLGIDTSTLDELAIKDHKEDLMEDLQKIKKSDVLSKKIKVTGLMYDVGNGRIEEMK